MSEIADTENVASDAAQNPFFSEAPYPAAGPLPAASAKLVLPLYTATMLSSALLLFGLQPMFAKMVLPLLGGAPSVWITAMLFFQATLLIGYAYAHGITRLMNTRRLVIVHLAVLLIALISLPVSVAAVPPAEGAPVLWLIGLLALSVGLPFFAVSTSAPLLQRWFAQSGHGHAADPYFLYGASNLGSMVALLSYPTLVEPLLTLQMQSWIWSFGYGLLVLLIALCGGLVFWGHAPAQTFAKAAENGGETIVWRRRALWVALAFAPSSLLLGVTTHITTDIAAVPLLWVVPLALYLFTFVLVFARKPLVKHSWMVALQPYIIVLVLLWIAGVGSFWLVVPIHLAVFFVTAMVCHGELARRRPSAANLTEFYFWMAFGGMLGGVFNALVAPVIFAEIHEYTIALVVALLLRPGSIGGGARSRVLDFALPAGLIVVILAARPVLGLDLKDYGSFGFVVVFCICYLLIFGFKERPLRYGLAVGALLFAKGVIVESDTLLSQERSFFGVYRVVSEPELGVNVFAHGTTAHGSQYTDPALWREPLSYHSRPGPLGQFFDVMGRDERFATVGLIGLGVGAALCHRSPSQTWWAYEIDPLVGQIAEDTRYFHYLEQCAPPESTHIRFGDGRLLLQGAAGGQFDLLIMDAFSSDSVPVHMITREAVELYLEKLSDGGVIMLNISNRFLDLTRVLGPIAADVGLAGLVQFYTPVEDSLYLDHASNWVALARDEADLAVLAADPRWQELTAPPDADLWTDNFSNILKVLH